MAAAYAHAHAAVGGAEGVDQSFAGLVLQILEGGSGDAQGQGVGLGFQVARPFSHHVEHNFAHGGIAFFRIHPWLFARVLAVPWDTGNRPAADVAAEWCAAVMLRSSQ